MGGPAVAACSPGPNPPCLRPCTCARSLVAGCAHHRHRALRDPAARPPTGASTQSRRHAVFPRLLGTIAVTLVGALLIAYRSMRSSRPAAFTSSRWAQVASWLHG
ncbi:MAG: hypothetical protein H0V33_06540 [Acidimicrobiia bacterium]|jgi:hypothetical protein|nr:hypothetical protein [Acidimicrobiia bacterium]